MKILRLAAALLLLTTESIVSAQMPAAKDAPSQPAVGPLIVDVHPSPYRSKIYYTTNIGNQRYDMRDATLLDLITLAYDREDVSVLGGPSWIDFDRFDVTARIDSLKAPKSTPVTDSGPNPAAASNESQSNPFDQIRPVMQRVLTERFHLTYHTAKRPLPGYVMTLAKGGMKMTEAKDPTAPMNCRSAEEKATPGQYSILCTSVTPARLISMFGGVYPHRVVDKTGLAKMYDFTFKMAFGEIRTRDEYVRAFTDAFRDQLGLVVTAQDVPQPAMFIDSVDHAPTPNAADIARLIPPMPDLEFEVASIKLAADNEPQGMVEPRGSQITFHNMSLQDLIVRGWDLPTGAMMGDAVNSLPKQRYTILVKLPPEIDARAVWQDQDQVNDMLKKLVIDRFQIKYHWSEQTLDGWVLLADNPKMKKADPNSRTLCKYGPPDGEKNMEGADSPFDNQSHCQNVTMTQFADTLQNLAKSEIKNHVVDKTGLTGSYDLFFYYSSARKLRAANAAAVAAAKENGAASSDPVGGMNIQDAFRKELGLKLEKQPLKQPILVLDHYEQKPTEN